MNSTIKKYIIEPLIYPFYRGNYRNFVIMGVFLTITSYLFLVYLYIEFLSLDVPLPIFGYFGFTVIGVIFSFLIFIFELGYIMKIFEESMKKAHDKFRKNLKSLVILGLKGFGLLVLYCFIVGFINAIISLIQVSNFTYIFFIILSIPILAVIKSILIGTILLSPLLPNMFPECLVFMFFHKLSWIVGWVIFPLIIFKFYNKISIKSLFRILFSPEYILTVTISGIYLILIFKYIVWWGIIKVVVIFYLLTVIARMFGVYFREIKEN